MNPILPIDLLVPLLLLTLAGSLFPAWRSTLRSSLPLRLALLACRFGAWSILAVAALNPGAWFRETRNENSDWALLLDRSSSMQVRDVQDSSRWQAAQELAAQAVQSDLSRRAKIIPFSARLEEVLPDAAAAEKLEANGAATDILRSLDELIGRYEGGTRKLAGIILLSDGRQIAAGSEQETALRACAQNAPIYPVCLGGPVEQKDLIVAVAQRHQITFAERQTPLAVHLENRHLGNVQVRVRLLDEDGKELDAQNAALPDNQTARVDLQFTPTEAGARRLQVVADSWPGETDLSNNTTPVAISVLTEKIQILFVEGLPHWDSKFLLQLLRRQPHLQATTVHRVTSERFFRVDLLGGDETETRSYFPDTQPDLNQYDIVAFGKGAEYFLSPERIGLLRDFVQDHGGALLFCRGKPYSGALPELEPLEALQWGAPTARAFRWTPTAAGEQAGLFGVLLPPREAPLWANLPPLAQARESLRLNPFAQVLVEGVFNETAARRLPLLVSRRIGRGLSITIDAEDLWRWDFFPNHPEAGAFYRQFWVSLFQWAASQSEFLPGHRLALRLAPSVVRPGEPVKAVVVGRDLGIGLDAAPNLHMAGPDAKQPTLTLKPVPGRSNEWATVFTLTTPGLYRLEASNASTAALERTTAVLEIRPPPGEEQNVSADPDFLARLAERSGGRVVTEQELAETIRSFAPREVATESGTSAWQPSWDHGGLLLLLALCLTGEWFLRRRNGLL